MDLIPFETSILQSDKCRFPSGPQRTVRVLPVVNLTKLILVYNDSINQFIKHCYSDIN